jgi:toxin ParE1/3/4
MKRSIQFLRQAKNESEESKEYYESKRLGLGREFAQEVDKTLQRIEERPEQFPEVYKTVRKALLDRFPFCIFFRIKEAVIQIIAVFHTSRDPEKWKGRV